MALADTLGALGVQVQLKWPNDVLKDGDKLAGILIETQAAAGGGIWAVIGIGLNLLMPDETGSAASGRSVAGMPWLARMDRDALMAALLDGLAACLREFDHAGFAAFSARWNLRMRGRARPSSCSTAASCCTKAAPPVSTTAARLLLDTDDGRITVLAGDVSLRVKA